MVTVVCDEEDWIAQLETVIEVENVKRRGTDIYQCVKRAKVRRGKR